MSDIDAPETSAPEPESALPTQSAAPAPSPVSQDTSDWQARYRGLQGTVTKKDKENEKLAGTISVLERELSDLRAQLETARSFEKSAAEKKAEVEKLQSEIERMRTAQDTQRVLTQEFPQLASVIPYFTSLPLEDARDALAAMQNTVAASTDGALKQALAGGSPVLGSTGQKAESTAAELDQLWEVVSRLAGSDKPDDVKEFRAAQSRIEQLQTQK